MNSFDCIFIYLSYFCSCNYTYIHLLFFLPGVRSKPEDFNFDLPEHRNILKKQVMVAEKKKKIKDSLSKMSQLVTLNDRINSTSKLLYDKDSDGEGNDENINNNSTYNTTRNSIIEDLRFFPLSATLPIPLSLSVQRIHTMLTTVKAINEYRSVTPTLLTIYIKVLPEGVIKRVRLYDSDSISHLYLLFHSCTQYGLSDGPMLILANERGMCLILRIVCNLLCLLYIIYLTLLNYYH